jgi:hypothetical protein
MAFMYSVMKIVGWKFAGYSVFWQRVFLYDRGFFCTKKPPGLAIAPVQSHNQAFANGEAAILLLGSSAASAFCTLERRCFGEVLQ